MNNKVNVIIDKKRFIEWRFYDNEDVVSFGEYCIEAMLKNKNIPTIEDIYYETGYVPERLILNKQYLIDIDYIDINEFELTPDIKEQNVIFK